MTESCELAELLDEHRELVGRIDTLAATLDHTEKVQDWRQRYKQLTAMRRYEFFLSERIQAMREEK